MSKVFVSYLPAILPMIEAASRKAILSACNEGRNVVIKNLAGTRRGRTPPRIYKVPGFNVYYTASAPGEYPAGARTGDLRGRVRTKLLGDKGYIGSNMEYALPLEKKPPEKGGRPWLRPSLNQARPAMLAELAKRWF